MLLKNLSQHNVKVEDKYFNKGGEGSIHNVLGDPSVVAKIYHPKGRTKEKEQKLRAMIQSPPTGKVASQIAWPKDVLYSPSGEFMGFLMPKIRNSVEISQIYSYDNRNKYYYAFFVKVAQNLCAAVGAVHSSGHVCGDLNHANIYVDPKTALVTLIDTDSYEITSKDGKRYRCPVCIAEYVPAEINNLLNKGENLRHTKEETFSTYTDNFAVGIHVFKLLMNGAHPFACRVIDKNYNGPDFTLVNNIVDGLFPYVEGVKYVAPPKYVPDINSFPESLKELMLKAFNGRRRYLRNRPTIQEWYDELEILEDSLVKCTDNGMHSYYKENVSCPLCECESRMNRVVVNPRPVIVKPIKNGVTVGVGVGTTGGGYVGTGGNIGTGGGGYIGGGGNIGTGGGGNIGTGGGTGSRGIISVLLQRIGGIGNFLLSAIILVFTAPVLVFKFLGTYTFGIIFGVASWAAVQYGVYYAMSFVTLDEWWGPILRGAVSIIALFIPLFLSMIREMIFGLSLLDFFDAVDNVYVHAWIPAIVIYPIIWVVRYFSNRQEAGESGAVTSFFAGLGDFFANIGSSISTFVSGLSTDGMFTGTPTWTIIAGGVVALIVLIAIFKSFMGFVVGIAVWSGFQVFAMWAFEALSPGVWWWWFVGLIVMGFAPYIPLWICYFIESAFIPISDFWDNMCLVMNFSPFLAIIGYGGTALVSVWGTGLLNVIITPILACAPAVFVFSKMPDATMDLI